MRTSPCLARSGGAIRPVFRSRRTRFWRIANFVWALWRETSARLAQGNAPEHAKGRGLYEPERFGAPRMDPWSLPASRNALERGYHAPAPGVSLARAVWIIPAVGTAAKWTRRKNWIAGGQRESQMPRLGGPKWSEPSTWDFCGRVTLALACYGSEAIACLRQAHQQFRAMAGAGRLSQSPPHRSTMQFRRTRRDEPPKN